jgi:hypothetical protein
MDGSFVNTFETPATDIDTRQLKLIYRGETNLQVASHMTPAVASDNYEGLTIASEVLLFS